MTLYNLIMGDLLGPFTRDDWARLGRGEVIDEETVRKMLMDGYAAVANEN